MALRGQLASFFALSHSELVNHPLHNSDADVYDDVSTAAENALFELPLSPSIHARADIQATEFDSGF